jgi:hypothetical protein
VGAPNWCDASKAGSIGPGGGITRTFMNRTYAGLSKTVHRPQFGLTVRRAIEGC